MRLDYLSEDNFVEHVLSQAASGRGGYNIIADVNQCVLSHDDERHRAIVAGADLVFSDSTVLQFARAVRHRVPMLRVRPGADVMMALCVRAADRGIAVGLLGGVNPAVAAALAINIKKRIPTFTLKFTECPSFGAMTVHEQREICERAKASGAQLLLVGLGCPKQERFMWNTACDGAPTMVGVGAAFDVIAGRRRQAPPWVHRGGLGWLYRLLSEPRRLWRRYLLTAPRFLLLLSWDAIRAPK
jgi:N-acetylglucosaminyldiphosphoundecaprenol N-acetyl-beta-D-mannosaminyltransferase